ncbi:MAG: PorT family protein [Bacteroidetes bacterium]|nr:PorT family protein [Bacteroidota bacterium]
MNPGPSCLTFMLITLTTFLAPSAFAQRNFHPGYLISHSGDTIRGNIKYKNPAYNPEYILFRASDTSDIRKINPADISGFGIGNQLYVSANVERTYTSTYQLYYSDYSPAPETRKETVFLKTLVDGAKSLYVLQTSIGVLNFYIRQDNVFTFLVYKKYLAESGLQSIPAENRKFEAQLSEYLNNDPGIQQEMQSLSYSIGSLENLFRIYYQDKESELRFQNQNKKTWFKYGLMAGISSTTLDFKKNSSNAGFAYNDLVNSNYSISSDFTGGVFFNLLLPGKLNHLSICNELLYSGYEIRGSYISGQNNKDTTLTKLAFSYLKINNLLRYSIPMDFLQFYCNLGVSNGLGFNRKNSKVYRMTTGDINSTKALENLRNWELGGIAGLGVQIRKLSFEARYEYANGMSGVSELRSDTRGFRFMLGYTF